MSTMTLEQVRDWLRNESRLVMEEDGLFHESQHRKAMADAIDAELAKQAAQPAEQPRGDGWREACEYMLAGRPDELACIREHAASLAAQPKPEQAVGDGVVAEGLELVRRLRDTPNWLKESFGDWKSATTKYDRAPKDAADFIERLLATPRPAVATAGDGVTDGSLPRTDREMLVFIRNELEMYTWVCRRCGHEEDTNTMDVAGELRGYLAQHPALASRPVEAAQGGVAEGLTDPDNPWRRAVEHAGYLVIRVESYMKARGEESIALEQVEGADEPTDEQLAALEAAAESAHEHWIGMRDGIYEFTKRRDRALAMLAAAPEV